MRIYSLVTPRQRDHSYVSGRFEAAFSRFSFYQFSLGALWQHCLA